MPISRRKFLTGSTVTAASLLLGAAGNHAFADPGRSTNRNFFDLSPLERRAIEADMLRIPHPPVTPVGTSPQVLYPFDYRRLLSEDAVNIYAAPSLDANVVRQFPPGFNFVSVLSQQGDWVEINYGEWVPESLIGPAQVSDFHGVLFEEALPYPLAWLLMDTKPSRYPGEPQPSDRENLPRYTRVSIFGKQAIGDWDWYLIGPDQWIEQRRIGKCVPVTRPAGITTPRWVAVDLYEQVLVAYEGTRPVFTTLVSSGQFGWYTDEGLFQMDPDHRFRAAPMEGALWAPDSYVIEDIPWTMYFNMFSQEALHGAYWHDGFGYRRSHGCVNMTITDSRWLFEWTAGGYEDSFVHIYYSQRYREDDLRQ